MRTTWLLIALGALLALLALSGFRPYDRATWALEVAPIVIALPILWTTYDRFPLTTLLYACIFVHAVVLMVGGAYTYARVPVGFQIAEMLGVHRNPYDKIGHFFQGFVPALATREILIRGNYVRGRRMLAFVAVCIVLAISATYELIECREVLFGEKWGHTQVPLDLAGYPRGVARAIEAPQLEDVVGLAEQLIDVGGDAGEQERLGLGVHLAEDAVHLEIVGVARGVAFRIAAGALE